MQSCICGKGRRTSARRPFRCWSPLVRADAEDGIGDPGHHPHRTRQHRRPRRRTGLPTFIPTFIPTTHSNSPDGTDQATESSVLGGRATTALTSHRELHDLRRHLGDPAPGSGAQHLWPAHSLIRVRVVRSRRGREFMLHPYNRRANAPVPAVWDAGGPGLWDV